MGERSGPFSFPPEALVKLFAQLTKVDVEKRLVYGRAASETPDKSGEIFDYETSKPLFEQWSQEFEKATDGKSLGNVRAMHKKDHAAGKVEQLAFNDAEKAIDVCVKVVDDGDWEKVQEGVYTGFSIGGEYAKRWNDPANAAMKRYTAMPKEISLVDNPCNADARFTMVKADGSSEEKAFAKVAARDDTSPKEGEDKYGDVKFADPKNKKYPIDTEQHIRAAWNYINKEKNAAKYSAEDVKSIKDKIVAAWKAKISKDGPPSAAEKAAETGELAKSMYDVGSFASLISSIQCLAENAFFEADYEQDASLVPEQLRAWLAAGVEIFKDMAAEESEELVGRFADKAVQAGALKKAGKKADSAIQQMHDHAVTLGADCSAMKVEPSGDLAKVTGERDEMAKKANEFQTQLVEKETARLTLEKSVSDLTVERDTIRKEFDEFKAANPKGAQRVVGTLSKQDDNGESSDDLAKLDDLVTDPAKLSQELMKAAHRRGVHFGAKPALPR